MANRFKSMVLILFLIILSVSSIAITQSTVNASITPIIEWSLINTRTLTNPSFSANDESRFVIQTSDGGFALLGALNDKTFAPHTGGIDNRTGLLMKVSGAGEKQWEKQYSEITYPSFILQTADSGFLMVGSQLGNYNIIMKLDAQGNFQWSKNYSIAFSSGIQTNDKNYVLAGQVIADNPYMVAPAIVKVSREGNLIWNRTYPSSSYSFASSILENPDGNFLVVGMKDGAWFAQIDSKGNLVMNRTYNELDGFLNSIALSKDGGFALAGGSFHSTEQPFVAKMDSSGTITWVHLVDNPFGDNGVSWSISSTVLNNGNCVLAVVPDLEGSAIFMFDTSGKELWRTTKALSEEPPLFYKVTASTDGGFAVAGTQNNSVSLIKYSSIGTTSTQPFPQRQLILIAIVIISAVIVVSSLLLFIRHRKASNFKQ